MIINYFERMNNKEVLRNIKKFKKLKIKREEYAIDFMKLWVIKNSRDNHFTAHYNDRVNRDYKHEKEMK